MEKLIIVRHGDYYYVDHDNIHLSDFGKQQIEALAEKLKQLIGFSRILILTSTADRARESTEILAKYLEANKVEEHEILWSDSNHKEDLSAVLRLVRRTQTPEIQVIILVTHLEYAEKFPQYFANKMLGIEVKSKSIEKGDAVVLNCIEKSTTFVSWSS